LPQAGRFGRSRLFPLFNCLELCNE
jgi:hypothetical protein